MIAFLIMSRKMRRVIIPIGKILKKFGIMKIKEIESQDGVVCSGPASEGTPGKLYVQLEEEEISPSGIAKRLDMNIVTTKKKSGYRLVLLS